MKEDKKILYISVVTSIVFTILIYVLKFLVPDIPHLEDTGYSWYFWKLPEPDMWARITSWTFYLLHQFLVWFFIYKLVKDKKKIDNKLSKYNWYLLITNGVFVVLHFIQTYIWYDGLAQDTPVWSSQASVIVMLVFILIMENRRRGLFFGKKVKLPNDAVKRVFKYHGYYIAWAAIFTFWYHPMEGTVAHLYGFFYMFLLFIQLSLAYTTVHQHPIWNFILEIVVLFHGTTVAIMQQNAMWPMFLFGFGGIFIVTQLYGLNLKKKTILITTISYVIFALVVYSGLFEIKTLKDLNEIIRIPMIEYILVFVFVIILQLPSYIFKKKKTLT